MDKLLCKKGGLDSTNPKDAMDNFFTKWIPLAFQPKEFNFKILLHHKIINVWPSKHKKQLPYMQWNILLGHKQMSWSEV